MTEKEKQLLRACTHGNKAAWDAFVTQYSSLVYHTIKSTFSFYQRQVAQDTVEDLYQEFFLCILRDDFKKLRQFKGKQGCSLASWIRVIAARLTIDYLRKEKISPKEAAEELAVEQPNALDVLAEAQNQRLLLDNLQKLPPRDRLIIELHYRQGLPPQEIAEILKVSVSAVYTQKSRVVSKLREILKDL